MRTANPALNDAAFESEAMSAGRSNVMTVNGAVVKTGVLVALLLAAAGVSWALIFPQGVGAGAGQPVMNRAYVIPFVLGGALTAFVCALVLCFSAKLAPLLAPVYAVAEGLFLGAISGLYTARFPGIAMQAALLTVGVLVVMLMLYGAGIVRATEKFKTGVIAATGAICLVYLISFVMSLFGVGIPYIHGNGVIGIGFSVVVVAIAALNLILDFDTIEAGARYGAPKYMEWYAGFGLLVTLVWLYLEILRLLAKIQSARD